MGQIGGLSPKSWVKTGRDLLRWKPAQGSMNFLRWFGALSFLTVALGAFGTAAMLSHFLAEEILQWDAVVTSEFIGTVAEIQSRYGHFPRKTGLAELIGKTATLEELGVSEAVARASVAEFLDHMRTLPGAAVIKVYTRDRSLAWMYVASDAPHPPADDATEYKTLANAFELPHSGAYTAIGRWDYHPADAASSAPGYYYVENYVPLRDSRDRVVAVVEINKEPARLEQTIFRGQVMVWLSLLAAGLLTFLTLFWLARHATSVMQDQQRRLVESETLSVIGEMSLAVAHGIRNPLGAIRSSAEIALDDAAPAAQKPLRDIIAQADRLSYWLRDLLQYSRPAPGRAGPVDVMDVLRESVESFGPRLSQGGVSVEWIRAQAAIPPVTADRPLLLQAFNGLISNAMEAMADGGKLTVCCLRHPEKKAVLVSIADTGQGMSEERLAQAFKPFKTTKARGLGIGLSLVKTTLERHGGQVRIESRPNEGTRVELLIPFAR